MDAETLRLKSLLGWSFRQTLLFMEKVNWENYVLCFTKRVHFMKSSYLCTKRLKPDVVGVNSLSEVRYFFSEAHIGANIGL